MIVKSKASKLVEFSTIPMGEYCKRNGKILLKTADQLALQWENHMWLPIGAPLTKNEDVQPLEAELTLVGIAENE